MQERVALVFLIGEDAQYSSRLPRFLASGRWDALRLKDRLDSVGRLSLQEQPINPAHDLRFLGHDLWLAVLTLAIPEEVLVRHGHLSVRKPLALTPCDVFGDVATLLLRQRGHDREQQLAFGIQRVDVLFLKVDLYAMLFQKPNGRQAVHRISGKAGNGLGDDEVNFPCEGLLNHVVELLALFRAGAGNASVGVDPHKFPV